MNFSYTEEQVLFDDMLNRLVQDAHAAGPGKRPLPGEPSESNAAMWATLAQVGALGILVGEDDGGIATSTQDNAIATHIAAKALGRGVANTPFISSAVIAASLLADMGNAAQREETLPSLVAGNKRITLAHAEAGPATELAHVQASAQAREARFGGWWRLEGRKLGVLDAGTADHFIVAARTSGAPADAHGISLFLLDRAIQGVQVIDRTAFDGSAIGELVLDNVQVPTTALLGTLDHGFAPMQHAIHRGMAALLAEATGVMERLVEMTFEYLKTRRQFGQPLSRFQALQHHAADMWTSVEQATSMSFMAMQACTLPDGAERASRLAAAKFLVGRNALQVSNLAVQLHGGIGMTAELPVGHYVRRLMVIDAMWGNASAQLEQYGKGLLADVALDSRQHRQESPA